MTKCAASLLFIVLLISCTNNKKPDKASKKDTVSNITSDTAQQHIIYPDTPDFVGHLEPLLAFWERHKPLASFDTSIDFSDQGFGAADPYYNTIEAGHLFSDTQIHAVLLYDFALADNDWPSARMEIYKKQGTDTSWEKVLDDTVVAGAMQFRYKDWNQDGIKDLCYVENGWEHGGHGPISWHLWLVDKKGVPRKVKGFEALDDPKIDSFTNHIFSDIEFHTSEQIAEYKLVGNKIIKISDDMVVAYDKPSVVTYYRGNKKIRTVKLKPQQLIFLPKKGEGIFDDP